MTAPNAVISMYLAALLANGQGGQIVWAYFATPNRRRAVSICSHQRLTSSLSAVEYALLHIAAYSRRLASSFNIRATFIEGVRLSSIPFFPSSR